MLNTKQQEIYHKSRTWLREQGITVTAYSMVFALDSLGYFTNGAELPLEQTGPPCLVFVYPEEDCHIYHHYKNRRDENRQGG